MKVERKKERNKISFFQDPLYGNIEIEFTMIRSFIKTYDILRLQHIRQANLTSLVFPGATHTRFAHTVGSVYLAQEAFDHLMNSPATKHLFTRKEWDGFRNFVMFFLLVHDCGHPPFSHVIEYATTHYHPRDDPNIKDPNDFIAFEKFAPPLDWNEINHEKIVSHILSKNVKVDSFKKYYNMWLTDWYPEHIIKDILLKNNDQLIDLLNLNEIGVDNLSQEISDVFTGNAKVLNKYPFLKTIVDSYIDLDRLDHLSRDAYGSGIKAALLNIYLIIHNYIIVNKNGKYVLGIYKDGIPSIVHLLTSREILYEGLYSQQNVRAYEAEFQRALIKLLANTDLDIDHILLSIDYFALKNMLDYSKKDDDKYSQHMLNRILSQNPHKLCLEYRYKRGSISDIDPSKITINKLEAVEEEIAKKLNIRKDDIIIYIEWTGNLEKLAKLSFGKMKEIPVIYKGEESTIDEYHPWIKNVITDWANRSSCRVYMDEKIYMTQETKMKIEKILRNYSVIP